MKYLIISAVSSFNALCSSCKWVANHPTVRIFFLNLHCSSGPNSGRCVGNVLSGKSKSAMPKIGPRPPSRSSFLASMRRSANALAAMSSCNHVSSPTGLSIA
jgi:hypothetical protein